MAPHHTRRVSGGGTLRLDAYSSEYRIYHPRYGGTYDLGSREQTPPSAARKSGVETQTARDQPRGSWRETGKHSSPPPLSSVILGWPLSPSGRSKRAYVCDLFRRPLRKPPLWDERHPIRHFSPVQLQVPPAWGSRSGSGWDGRLIGGPSILSYLPSC